MSITVHASHFIQIEDIILVQYKGRVKSYFFLSIDIPLKIITILSNNFVPGIIVVTSNLILIILE